MSWNIHVEASIFDDLEDAPVQVQKKFDLWMEIVNQSGPEALRCTNSWNDEKLLGKLKGKRSSRLNKKWRVEYVVEKKDVYVVKVHPHTYERNFGGMTFVPARRTTRLTTAEVLKFSRELLGLTQAELAEESGVAQSAISSLEAGKLALGMRRAEKFSQVFGVSADFILNPNRGL